MTNAVLARPTMLNPWIVAARGAAVARRRVRAPPCGSFLDLDCPGAPETCPQFPRTSVTWQPPTTRAEREAPGGLVHFFLVVRDDRGGLSFAHATATPQ